jgi:hypothetical protein
MMIGFVPSPAPAEPAPNGMDWGAGRLRVLGVGTPRLLSPTGSLLLEDATELARDHARRRLAEALLALPVADGDADARSARQAAAARVPGLVRFGEPRAFSDGTIHLPAEVDVPAALGHGVAASEPEMALHAPPGFIPCLRLRLQRRDGTTSTAGLPGDPTPHLRYGFTPAGSTPAVPVPSMAAPCTLTLDAAPPRSLRIMLSAPSVVPTGVP